MWGSKNDKIILDHNKIRKDFKKTFHNDLVFIRPEKNVWGWEDDEKWLRSIVIDKDGYVRSVGWPKFGNYGEFNNDTKFLNESLENNSQVVFTHKEDGSLCIRSVIDNEIIFRTRGTIDGATKIGDELSSFNERFMQVAKHKYPILLDPHFMPNHSLLFEYVGPFNKVVMSYEEEDLILIGGVQHSDLIMTTWPALEFISKQHKLNLVSIMHLPKSPELLLEEIKNWKTEGIVARCKAEQILVKVKSAYYLANHRLKSNMKYSTILEFIFISGINTEDELINYLKKCDYDWEIIESAKEFYYEYLKYKDLKNRSINKAKQLHDEFFKEEKNKAEPLVRKEFAQIACAQDQYVRPLMFAFYDGKMDVVEELGRKIVETEGRMKKK